MERYREGEISINKFEFYISAERGDLFPLIHKWLGIALQNGVKDLKFTYTNTRSFGTFCPLPIFKFLTAKSLRELILTGCDLMHLSLSTSHVANWDSLTKLSLSNVSLDHNILQTLLASCPLIVNLIIDHCNGVKNIELRNLRKIASLNINVYQCVKIQAPTLEYLSYSGPSSQNLDIVEYHNLKSLEISCTGTSHGFMEHLISTAHFLESLKLVNIALEIFDICRSQSLRVLKIQNCEIGGAIDAPNLVLFEYKGHLIRQVTFAKEPSQLKDSQIFLDCWYNLGMNGFVS